MKPCLPCRWLKHDECGGGECYCLSTGHQKLLQVLKREHGKPLPMQTVSIMRPGLYGNPYVIDRDGNRDEVIALYSTYLAKKLNKDKDFEWRVNMLREVADALLCCCAPQKCHGDVLSEYLAKGVV